jgi:hypothetical protein
MLIRFVLLLHMLNVAPGTNSFSVLEVCVYCIGIYSDGSK